MKFEDRLSLNPFDVREGFHLGYKTNKETLKAVLIPSMSGKDSTTVSEAMAVPKQCLNPFDVREGFHQMQRTVELRRTEVLIPSMSGKDST